MSTNNTKKYAQHMEIKLEDMKEMLKSLMRAGYDCRVRQDGESMDIVMIDYLHPEWNGCNFVESED